MCFLKKTAGVAFFAVVLVSLAPAAKADEASWATKVVFAEPVQIGSMVLSAGSYIIERSPGIVSSTTVLVYSIDRERWEGLVTGIPVARTAGNSKTAFAFERLAPGSPQALQRWYYQDWSYGIEFPSPSKTARASNIGNSSIATIAHSAK